MVIRIMRHRTKLKYVFCVIALCAANSMPLLPEVFSQQVSTEPTVFYLHTGYLGGAPWGRILSTDPPYGVQRWSLLTETAAFILHPPLGRLVRIGGTVTFRLWLRGSTSSIAIINATLVEITDEGRTLHVCGIEAPVLVESSLKDQPHVFAVGPIIRTIAASSMLVLQILAKGTKSSVFLYWDDDRTPSQLAIPFVERYYHAMNLVTRDFLDREVKGANVTVTQNGTKVWTGITDVTGSVVAVLPSTEGTRPYDMRVYWKGSVVNETRSINLTEDMQLILRCEVYDLTIAVQDFFGLPLSQAKVDLIAEGMTIASNKTRFDGLVVLPQIPKGDYVLVLSYDSFQHVTGSLILFESTKHTVTLQVVPVRFYYGIVTVAGILVASFLLLSKRRQKTQRVPFEFLNEVLGGEIPAEAAVMIIGNPGSGKTVLMQKLMYDQLNMGRTCVFVTNNDFPKKITNDMKQLGLDVSRFDGKQLALIDCYSGTAGLPSSEKYSVQVLTDLTGLGMQISSAASALGEGTTFFFDSVAPLFTSLKPDPIMTFVHSIGARIKGQGGSLYFSVGTGLDSDTLSRLEGLSDCIIELETFERRGISSRRLRVKKIRGRKHSHKWVEFSIEAPQGIVFHSGR